MVIKNNGDTTAYITAVKANNVDTTTIAVAVGSFTGLTDIGYSVDLDSVQGHPLNSVLPFDLPAGQTAIVYAYPATGFEGIGDSVQVSLTIQGYSAATQTVTAEDGTGNQ